MKKFTLNQIVEIQAGLVLSRTGAKQLELIKRNVAEKVSDITVRKYKAITLRSITDVGILDLSQCDDFDSKEEISDRYLTHNNDILVRMFTPLKCCLINSEEENLVVPSQFCILKLKDSFRDIILPEYLYLVMRNKDFSKQVQKLEEGFQLRSIKTSSIAKIKINIPDIATQEKLINVSNLIIRKEKLMSELIIQEKLYNETILEKLIKGEI